MNIKAKVIEKHYKLEKTIDHIFSKNDNDEECIMHSKNDEMEIMINEKADEVVEELLKSLFNRYQINLEKLFKGSEFVFNYVRLLYYKFHEIYPDRGGLIG